LTVFLRKSELQVPYHSGGRSAIEDHQGEPQEKDFSATPYDEGEGHRNDKFGSAGALPPEREH